MDNPGQPLLTDPMVDHCSITMVKPCLTIVKTNHASPILQKCQNHGEAWFNHCIPCYSMVLQLWFSMVKHDLTMVKHGYTHIISQGRLGDPNGPHIVHLITMCHLYDGSARAAIFTYMYLAFGLNLIRDSRQQRKSKKKERTDRSEKHKLGRRRWDLASCQISLNFVQRF